MRRVVRARVRVRVRVRSVRVRVRVRVRIRVRVRVRVRCPPAVRRVSRGANPRSIAPAAAAASGAVLSARSPGRA